MLATLVASTSTASPSYRIFAGSLDAPFLRLDRLIVSARRSLLLWLSGAPDVTPPD